MARWGASRVAAALAVAACGHGATDDAALDGAPQDSRVPSLCQGVDVGEPSVDCLGASGGWYYDGSACAHTDCCVSEQCSALTETLDECELRHAGCVDWRSRKLAFECVAQDAWAPADCTARVRPPGFAWHGAVCEPLSCPCLGLDCDTVWDGQFECAQQHASCDPSATARDQCVRKNAPQQLPADAAFAEAKCTQDGASDCDADGFMGQSAVECIARAAGLQQGLNAWGASLQYNVNYRRVYWRVKTTLTRRGFETSGEDLLIDATTGIVFGKGAWSAVGYDDSAE